MFTRNEFMTTPHRYQEHGERFHRQYYGQFDLSAYKRRVLQHIGLDALLASKDPYLNDIPLHRWDSLAVPVPATVAAMMREAGDYPTLGGAVCCAKEAARQLIEENSRS